MQTGISKQGDYAEYSSQAGIDKTVQNNLIIPINGPASLYSFIRFRTGGWSKALLALFACHPKFLASAKLFAVPKVPKVPNF